MQIRVRPTADGTDLIESTLKSSSNSLEDLLFTIVVEGGMLSSLPKLVQSVPQSNKDRESWTIEFSRQRIDTDCYIGTRFCHVPHLCSLMASEFEPSKIRVSL
jgi:hypothetical protein